MKAVAAQSNSFLDWCSPKAITYTEQILRQPHRLDGGMVGRGYLLKERVLNFDELGDAVRQVASGGMVLDPLVVEALLSQPRSATILSRLIP